MNEQLKDIKHRYKTFGGEKDAGNLAYWDVDYLIEQAEKVEHLLETLRAIDAVANFGHADELSAVNFKLIRELCAKAQAPAQEAK